MSLKKRISNGTLTGKQSAAIIYAVGRGRHLESIAPEAGTLYQQGYSLARIATEYNLDEEPNTTLATAEKIVKYGLRGFDPEKDVSVSTVSNGEIKPYEGMLGRERYDQLAKEHRANSSRNRKRE